MNRFLPLLAALALAVGARAEVEIPLYDHVTYYDGYLVGNIPEDAPDEGVQRLYTYLNTVPLTDAQLDLLGEHLRLDLTIHSACDNYDRIGSVNLAFNPKGAEGYTVAYDDAQDPMRIEIARFITPFMNKNIKPYDCPYSFTIDNLSAVLRNRDIREVFDIWLELEVFGVPYAAQTQVTGCAGCIDVFRGSLSLVTDDTPAGPDDSAVFLPIVTRRSDWRADRGLNNYNEACTDELGKTVRTWSFELPVDVTAGRVVVMMSNHGAGTNGEEYVRRMHYASFDDGAVSYEWKPGRTSCEPYRQYNTQSNGIYGRRPKSDESWQSFSNWCPGASIPYQTFETGPLAAGIHTVKIEVPDAVFYGSDGYFPVSIYFQGDTNATSISAPNSEGTAGIEAVAVDSKADYRSRLWVEGTTLTVDCPEGIEMVEIFDLEGRLVMGTPRSAIDLSAIARGVYMVAVHTSSYTEVHKAAL